MGFYELVSVIENKSFNSVLFSVDKDGTVDFGLLLLLLLMSRRDIGRLSCIVQWRIQDFLEVGTSLAPSLNPPMQFILTLADLEGAQKMFFSWPFLPILCSFR